MNKNFIALGISVVGWIAVIAWVYTRSSEEKQSAYHIAGSTPVAQSYSQLMKVNYESVNADKTTAENDYGLGTNHISKLIPYPKGGPGTRTPFDLWRYAGKGESSWKSPVLPMPWEEWVNMLQKQKPILMADVDKYMNSRYNFNGQAIAGVTMSGGKPVMQGPIARLPKGIISFEQLAKLSPEEIRERDLFPYKPLAHPLQTTAHMVFPDSWIKVHPEHERIDVDMDLPDAYLPEFPAPLFLTTHKELGDVTKGREITLENYYEIFNGLLTGEQMEGLKELLRPTPTTWFNHTTHRVTLAPSQGVACMSCHVNGHTNGAIELAPDSRPNQARLNSITTFYDKQIKLILMRVYHSLIFILVKF